MLKWVSTAAVVLWPRGHVNGRATRGDAVGRNSTVAALIYADYVAIVHSEMGSVLKAIGPVPTLLGNLL
jgi:hypothetical protein